MKTPEEFADDCNGTGNGDAFMARWHKAVRLTKARDAEWAAQLAEARSAALREAANRITFRRDKWFEAGEVKRVNAADALLADIAAIEAKAGPR